MHGTVAVKLKTRVEIERGTGLGGLAGDAKIHRGVEEDFVLLDLLNHDLHFVIAVDVNERPAAGVEGDETLLNEGGEFEPAANLVDDFFFAEVVDHVESVCPGEWGNGTGSWRWSGGCLLAIRLLWQAGGEQDGLHGCKGVIHIVVDDPVAVMVRFAEFAVGNLEPPGNCLWAFGATAAKPLFQLAWIGRLNEYRHRLRISFENRKGTLNIDFKHYPLAAGQPGADLILQRAVPVLPAVDLAALDEIACGPPTVEISRR